MDDYVRKEVFDAEIKRLEYEQNRAYEKLVSEFRLQGQRHRKDIDAVIASINAVNRRVDDLKDSVNRNFALLAFCITALGIILAGLQIFGG